MELYSQLLLKLQWRLKEDNDYEGIEKKEKWKQGRSRQFLHNAYLCKINLGERPALNLLHLCRVPPWLFHRLPLFAWRNAVVQFLLLGWFVDQKVPLQSSTRNMDGVSHSARYQWD